MAKSFEEMRVQLMLFKKKRYFINSLTLENIQRRDTEIAFKSATFKFK